MKYLVDGMVPTCFFGKYVSWEINDSTVHAALRAQTSVAAEQSLLLAVIDAWTHVNMFPYLLTISRDR